MKTENETDVGNGILWLVIAAVVAAAITSGYLLVKRASSVTEDPKAQAESLMTENVSNAKQLMLSLRMYADDEDGRFPASMEEIMPKYCTSDRVFWNTVADCNTRVRWLYAPNHKLNEAPVAIVISSSPNREGKRVVGYTDGTVRILDPSEKPSP